MFWSGRADASASPMSDRGDSSSRRKGQPHLANRRQFLTMAGASGAALSLFPSSIRKALAIPAAARSGTIEDVQHVVILMQENRSFDHYFGSLRGVRGFGDRHPMPLASGKPVWNQSDGAREVLPYHLDTATTSAMRVPDMPHHFADAQAAWNQGAFGFWPKFKTPYSMGYYRRADLPFQFALAEAFTLCDAYHCSITGGTYPNRVMFWSGSNADPALRARGENATAANSEPDNLRAPVKDKIPVEGYRYDAPAFAWKTIPEILGAARVSWRIYQNPRDNWNGLMHGGLAFESFRTARPGSPLYENGMRHYSLKRLARDAATGALPQVSWILPPARWSEHPTPSSPAQGAQFTAHVLRALTRNPQTWSKTAFFVVFDENDGLFDHVPPPAPPSFNLDGSLAGKSTLDLAGEYFSDAARAHLDPADRISGTLRPWGLGTRVPAYVISPWSRGGWVNSQVFDHTSIGQFLEKRFAVTVPGISPWHRAICGDMVSAFDFAAPNDRPMPGLPDTHGSQALVARLQKRPSPLPPSLPVTPFQETGSRNSRALPYILHVDARVEPAAKRIVLDFANDGAAGAVFHVYDKRNSDRIPRRYTVEAGKRIADDWEIVDVYDLWVMGPNGFLREFQGGIASARIEPRLRYSASARRLRVAVRNVGAERHRIALRANAYVQSGPRQAVLAPRESTVLVWDLSGSANWYDFSIEASGGFARRFAGRMETGSDGLSDPAMDLPVSSPA
jgi:phospholipase C